MASGAVFAVSILAVVVIAPCSQFLQSFLFLKGTLFDAFVHLLHVYVLNAEAGGKQSDFDLCAQLRVFGHTEFGLEVAVELVHKVLHLIHLAHHKFVLRAVGYVEQHFL